MLSVCSVPSLSMPHAENSTSRRKGQSSTSSCRLGQLLSVSRVIASEERTTLRSTCWRHAQTQEIDDNICQTWVLTSNNIWSTANHRMLQGGQYCTDKTPMLPVLSGATDKQITGLAGP